MILGADFEVEIHSFTDPSVGQTYGFLLHHHPTNKTLGLDAGKAEPLLNGLQTRGWNLDELWITHHDPDHSAATLEVKQVTGCVVTGPKNQTAPIQGLDRLVQEGDALDFAGQQAQIMHMPGHTNDMLNYYFAGLKSCFVADVIFPMGCGRVKEGTMAQMWSSLQKIMQLPDDILLFSCHEYAQNNAAFALSVEPENADLLDRIDHIETLRAKGKPTVPSTLSQELATNPFLRVEVPAIRQRLKNPQAQSQADLFAQLRTMKDTFKVTHRPPNL